MWKNNTNFIELILYFATGTRIVVPFFITQYILGFSIQNTWWKK